MLDKERFLAIKKLANKIRHDNENLFKKFDKELIEDAISEKEEFIENVIDSMGIEFDEGEQGREEKQIFRANILLPDDMDFFEAYSKDKNIRNLMNKYAVSIEDVMSKITELNIYGDYLDSFEEDTDGFVDEMVNISSKEAANLLEEIEDLSNVMDSLNIPVDDIKETKVADEKPLLTPEEIQEDSHDEEKTDFSDLDNISNAVEGFVKEYNNLQDSLNSYKENIEEATEKIATLKRENEELKRNNLEAVNALNEAKDAKNRLEAENMQLKDRMKLMEDKLTKSATLLKRIYNSIPKGAVMK